MCLLIQIMPLLNFEIPKLYILLKHFVSATPLKLLNRIMWNLVVIKAVLDTLQYFQGRQDSKKW